MSEFGLPPRRELPAAVRDGIRLKLQEGMDRPRRRSWRGPAVAAAAVAVLAAGAFVVTTGVRDSGDGGPVVLPAEVKVDAPLVRQALDRCWAALVAAGKDGAFPDRRAWQPLAGAQAVDPEPFGVTVLVRGEDEFVVCDTTTTSVTVSDPDAPLHYAPGTSTAALLAAPTGAIAGVTEERGEPLLRLAHPGGDSTTSSVEPANGVFLKRLSARPAGATLTFDGRELVAPAPAVSVVDRPTPGVDRTSDRGRLLGDCLAGTREPIADPGSYQPGASLVEGPTTVLVGSFGDRFVSCAVNPGGFRTFETDERLLAGEQRVRSAEAFLNGIGASEQKPGGRFVVVGFVPPETARMEVRRANGKPPLTPVVAGGTFIAVLPEDFEREASERLREDVTIVLYDARDEPILEQQGQFPERY